MKKRIAALYIIITVLTITAISITIVNAEEDNLDSEVEIQFEEGNAGVEPVDPENPEDKLDPGEGEEGETGGSSGPLALNYVSHISFGLQELYSTPKDYLAETIRPFVQVTDLRGTGTGWRVSAKAGKFFSNLQPSLPGSTITLKSPEGVSPTIGLMPPAVFRVDLITDGVYSADVVTAAANQGLGTWVTRWFPTGGVEEDENDNVLLNVLPGTATVTASHIAKITWTLIAD